MPNEPRTIRDASPSPRLGTFGIAARIAVGVTLLVLALFWRDPDWIDAVVGLLVMPLLVIAVLSLRTRRDPRPLDATGPVGHCVNALVFVPLLLFSDTAGAAFLFYGTSMLVAAARRSGGCEVTAIANAVLQRDDQVGCVLFAPVDTADAARHRTWAGAVGRGRQARGASAR